MFKKSDKVVLIFFCDFGQIDQRLKSWKNYTFVDERSFGLRFKA